MLIAEEKAHARIYGMKDSDVPTEQHMPEGENMKNSRDVIDDVSACVQPSDLEFWMDELCSYWLKSPGFSLKFARLKRCRELTDAEQLFAALLRRDANASRSLLSRISETQLQNLITLTDEPQFARLIFERLFELEVIGMIPQFVKDRLTELSLKEAAVYKFVNNQIANLAGTLGEFSDDIVWIKGAALAATVYKSTEHRLSRDVDLVVSRSRLRDVVHSLQSCGFKWHRIAADCYQIGCGPTEKVEDLLLLPAPDFAPISIMTLYKSNHPEIDIKVNPFDTGWRMRQVRRFFSNSQLVQIKNHKIRVPDLVDHMMICLHTAAKENFVRWKPLFDVHMFCRQFEQDPRLWNELVARCLLEGLAPFVFAGLVLVADRFASPVPTAVLQRLSRSSSRRTRFLTFIASKQSAWNSNSLPMLVLSAASSTDRSRRLRTLARSFRPRRNFLSRYYHQGRNTTGWTLILLLILHWCVIILPAGVTRRTIGRALWPSKIQNLIDT
jgi:hypothetical protein